MQAASNQVTQCKKMISELQEEIDQLQKLQRDANNKVRGFFVIHMFQKLSDQSI